MSGITFPAGAKQRSFYQAWGPSCSRVNDTSLRFLDVLLISNLALLNLDRIIIWLTNVWPSHHLFKSQSRLESEYFYPVLGAAGPATSFEGLRGSFPRR